MSTMAAIEAQGRKELKARLRNLCLEKSIDLDKAFEDAPGRQKDKNLITQASFYSVLSQYEITLTDEEKNLLLVFSTPSGLISISSFLEFVDVHKPTDHVDPELVFPLLPQPFRMIHKVLENDILDRAWAAITSTISFKLQQGEMNADLQEKEAKSRVCFPSATVDVNVNIATLSMPCLFSGDYDAMALVHNDAEIEIVDSTASTVIVPRTKVLADSFCMSYISSPLKPMLCGSAKCIYFAIAARHRELIPSSTDTGAPPVEHAIDPAYEGVESLVHIYSTTPSSLSHRIALTSKYRVVKILLSDDLEYMTLVYDHGLVQVYSIAQILSPPSDPPATITLDSTKDFLLEIDPSLFNICPVPKPVAPPEQSSAKPDTKSHKTKGKDVETDTAVVVQTVYNQYLFVSFVLVEAKSWRLAVATQQKLLIYSLSSKELCTTVFTPDAISCVAIDAAHNLLALGLENGAILVWHVKLQAEHSALGCHGSAVREIFLLKSDYLVSLSSSGELHFYDLSSRTDLLPHGDAYMLGYQYDPFTTPLKVDGKAKPYALIRVIDGQSSEFLRGFQDLPIICVGHTDASISIHDIRSGILIGYLGLEAPEWRGPNALNGLGAHWFLSGDHLAIPTCTNDMNRLRICHFTLSNILECCFPSPLKRLASDQYLEYLGQKLDTSMALEMASKAKRPSLAPQRRRIAPKNSEKDVNSSTEAVPTKKTLESMYLEVLKRQMQSTSERDARMAKRRAVYYSS